MNALTIADAFAEAVIIPRMGAGLARYDLLRDGRRMPILRPAPSAPESPFELALNLLIPWSNRISGGGFRWNGVFHPLSPNLVGEPFPIHGDAFASPWRVEEAGADRARLSLASPGVGPFRYEAEVAYRLQSGALTMALAIVSRSAIALPFGCGFHPCFVRSRETWLRAPAPTLWLEDARHLPAGGVRPSERPDWDFTASRALPDGWINNAFEGWDGAADIDWRDRDLSVAAPPLRRSRSA